MLLHIMREGAKSGVAKFILFGLMTLAVGGLVLMDVGGFFRNGARSPDTVAVVGGQTISAQSFDQRARRIISRQSLDAATAYRLGFMNQILEGEISSALLYRQARDLGLRIDDTVMARQVSQLVKPYVSETMSGKEALRRILMNQGMSEEQFVQAMRTEMSNTVLRNAVLTGSGYVSPLEARDLYQYKNEKRTVQTVLLPQAAIKDHEKPTDEVLKPLYEAGKEQFAIPETRKITLAVLSPSSVENTLAIDEAELKQAYEKDKDSFKTPERRMLEQSVLQDEAKAQAVAAKIKEDASMKDAVKAATGKTDAYLGQDKFQQEGMAEELASPSFTAEKGAVIGPVKTALGWHVLIVKDIIPAVVRPYAEVREELRKDMIQTKLADQLYTVSGQIDDQIAGGAELKEVADNNGMTLKQYGPLREDGSTPDDKEGIKDHEKDRAEILKAAFDLQEGETSPVMELSDGGYAVVQADQVTAKSYKSFESVRDQIAKIWISDQQQSLNKKKAQEAMKALAAKDKTLEAIARENGASVQTVTLSRSDQKSADLNAQAIAHFFETAVNDYATVVASDGIVIGHVTAATLPPADKISAKDISATAKAEAHNLQQETFQAYMSHLRGKYGVRVNDKVLQTMYTPVAADDAQDTQ